MIIMCVCGKGKYVGMQILLNNERYHITTGLYDDKPLHRSLFSHN